MYAKMYITPQCISVTPIRSQFSFIELNLGWLIKRLTTGLCPFSDAFNKKMNKTSV